MQGCIASTSEGSAFFLFPSPRPCHRFFPLPNARVPMVPSASILSPTGFGERR
jgi:hypothetical protein